jgi:ADP-sugar diphosphatase
MGDDITGEFKIQNWIEHVKGAGCRIESVKEICQIRKPGGELLFALLDTKVYSPEGNKLPHIAFIRGHACLIVPLLRNIQTGEERFLMVKQRRIGNGFLSLEFPAGMLDEESDPACVAVRELHEETGLQVDRSELFPLTDSPIYSSAGASDEAIYFFGCIKEINNEIYESFKNREIGNEEEDEFITVALYTKEEALPQITSIQARLAFYLFEEKSGKDSF